MRWAAEGSVALRGPRLRLEGRKVVERSHVIAWDEILAYFTEARERAIADMASADDTKQIWKAQGKVDLCNELLNLRAIFQTLAQSEEDATQAKLPTARDLSREAYRVRLQEGKKDASHPSAA